MHGSPAIPVGAVVDLDDIYSSDAGQRPFFYSATAVKFRELAQMLIVEGLLAGAIVGSARIEACPPVLNNLARLRATVTSESAMSY